MQQDQHPEDGIGESLKKITAISAVLFVLMLAVYAVLGRFSIAVLLGGLIGLAAALMNLVLLGRTVRDIAHTEDTVLAQNRMRASYTTRMMGMAAAAVAAFLVPQTDGIACLVALVIPKVAVMLVQYLDKWLGKRAKD
ncbi:MAG: hypothetical protein IJ573_08575 [Clostridia bacterium]|nr:hypothetical protein [Clostridia bacterium]